MDDSIQKLSASVMAKVKAVAFFGFTRNFLDFYASKVLRG